MTHAHVAPAAGFKHCCMLTGQYDGSDRAYFFQGMSKSYNRTVETGARESRARL